ncbi:unnamed protein product, partial [Rotaria sp. Silwood2]
MHIAGNDSYRCAIVGVAIEARKDKELKAINLRCRQIGDEEMWVLCYWLCFNKSLTALDLQSNQIGATELKYLSEALCSNE